MIGRSYPPLTWELAVAIAFQWARWGNRYRRAVGVLVSFDCLLRVGELVGLYREDVADAGDLRVGVEHKGMVLRLRKTKTGRNKEVRVLEPIVLELLRGLVRTTGPRQLLFPFSTATFRRDFHAVCDSLSLSPLFVPHSLRHGGATRYRHVFHWPMEDIKDRGRWASVQSAQRYIQSGLAMFSSSFH